MSISIGCFVGNPAGLEYVNAVGKDYPIHVGFFKLSDFDEYAHDIGPDVKISSCHLPCWFSGDWLDLRRIVQWCVDRIDDKQLRMVIHPNKRIYDGVKQLLLEESRYYYRYREGEPYFWDNHIFCLENFPWKVRRKKIMVTPMEILIHNASRTRFGLCLDVAHLDLQWFIPSMLYPLLEESTIIHFSNQNRKPKKHHLPFQEGSANLFMILDYLKKHDLHPEVVLEYQVEYKKKGYCERDYEYLIKYLSW